MLRIRDPALRMRRITVDDEEEEEALEAAISRRNKKQSHTTKRKKQRHLETSSSSIDEERFPYQSKSSSSSTIRDDSDCEENRVSSIEEEEDVDILEVPSRFEATEAPAPTHQAFGFQHLGRVTRRETTPSSEGSVSCMFSLHDVTLSTAAINPGIYSALEKVPCGGAQMDAMKVSLQSLLSEDVGYVLVNDGEKVISLSEHLKLLYRLTWFVIIVDPFHLQPKV
jgi:hypothetical protein